MKDIRDNRARRKAGHNLPASGRNSRSGFTLVELLVTLAVAAILLAVAVPSFRTFVQNAQLANTADGFLGAIQRARSEAITRGDPVILCRTGDPSTRTCRANEPDGSANQSNDWTPGWLMYVKEGYTGSGGVSGDYTGGSGETLIKAGEPASGGATITSDSDGDQWLAFFPDGSLNESGAVQYAVCDERGATEDISKMIIIQSLGRPYMKAFDAGDTCSPS